MPKIFSCMTTDRENSKKPYTVMNIDFTCIYFKTDILDVYFNLCNSDVKLCICTSSDSLDLRTKKIILLRKYSLFKKNIFAPIA